MSSDLLITTRDSNNPERINLTGPSHEAPSTGLATRGICEKSVSYSSLRARRHNDLDRRTSATLLCLPSVGRHWCVQLSPHNPSHALTALHRCCERSLSKHDVQRTCHVAAHRAVNRKGTDDPNPKRERHTGMCGTASGSYA